MEQKNGWFAFWQKLMKCLSKQDETGVGDTKSVAPVNTIIQSIKGVSSSKEKDSSKVKSLTESVDTFLKSRYDFRYNVLTEETEYRLLERMEEGFAPVNQRVLNTFCLEAHESGISCWDRDLSRCIFSTRIAEYHPFKLYLEELPVWDGVDRLAALARRVSRDQLWVKEFHIWMRGMTAQWMGVTGSHANSVAPLLISTEQGYLKSTFCKSLLPPALQRYYMDKVDLTSQGHIERRLAEMGLLNLDEFDTLSPARMQELKSLITQDVMNERKVYDIQNYTFIRRASFIASTNNPHCLPDIGENRRILFNTLLEIDYHTPVNHQGIYAQAYALYRQGFQYWYENQEITFLNNRNEAFRQKDPLEENLFFYFRAARPNDIQAKWYPASQLLSILSMNGRTQANAQMKQMLVTVLENNHFHSRKTSNNITEYWVVEYSAEERKENSIRPQLPVQTGLEL